MLDPLDGAMRTLFGSVLDGYLYPFILEGMRLTVELALLSVLVASELGMLTALAKLSHSKTARSIAGVYTTIIRGVPDIVLMFIIFYGGQLAVNDLGYRLADLGEQWALPFAVGWDYVEISEFTAGVVTIGVIFGAYMGETFRGGILAVPRGEIEAASRAAELREQLAGADEDHRPGLRHRPRGHGLPRCPGRRHDAPAVHLLRRGGRAVPGHHGGLGRGTALAQPALQRRGSHRMSGGSGGGR